MYSINQDGIGLIHHSTRFVRKRIISILSFIHSLTSRPISLKCQKQKINFGAIEGKLLITFGFGCPKQLKIQILN